MASSGCAPSPATGSARRTSGSAAARAAPPTSTGAAPSTGRRPGMTWTPRTASRERRRADPRGAARGRGGVRAADAAGQARHHRPVAAGRARRREPAPPHGQARRPGVGRRAHAAAGGRRAQRRVPRLSPLPAVGAARPGSAWVRVLALLPRSRQRRAPALAGQRLPRAVRRPLLGLDGRPGPPGRARAPQPQVGRPGPAGPGRLGRGPDLRAGLGRVPGDPRPRAAPEEPGRRRPALPAVPWHRWPARSLPSRRRQRPDDGRATVRRLVFRAALFVVAVLLVASVVDGYAAGWADRLVDPFPTPPTTTTWKEVTAP